MTYKDHITHAMNKLAKDPKTVFVGYNLAYGSHAYGTLEGIPKNRILETPIAENLMVGMAMGMSLEGYKPIVIFERHDFLWIAMDAIRNHLDMMPRLSGGQFDFPVIIRTIVGTDTPLDPGVQHKQDYTDVLHEALDMPIITIRHGREAASFNRPSSGPRLFVEWRDRYNQPTLQDGRRSPGVQSGAR